MKGVWIVLIRLGLVVNKRVDVCDICLKNKLKKSFQIGIAMSCESDYEEPMVKYRIIRREGNKLEIEADAEWFESVVRSAYEREQIKKVRRCEQAMRNKAIDQSEYSEDTFVEVRNYARTAMWNSGDIKETQDLYRRLPHFFMSKFKKWLKMQKYMQKILRFLSKIQQRKKSKQQRFELGDLQKCFQVDEAEAPNNVVLKGQLRSLFIQFLQNEASLQIMQYNKLNSLEQKQKYIQVIPDILKEMYKDKPFNSFLSQENIQTNLTQRSGGVSGEGENEQVEQQPPLSPEIQDESEKFGFKDFSNEAKFGLNSPQKLFGADNFQF